MVFATGPLRKPSQIENAFPKATRINPRYVASHFRLRTICGDRYIFPTARKVAAQTIRIEKPSSQGHGNLAYLDLEALVARFPKDLEAPRMRKARPALNAAGAKQH
jgi:hypothetical protein